MCSEATKMYKDRFFEISVLIEDTFDNFILIIFR
jgi:hypothetical protein